MTDVRVLNTEDLKRLWKKAGPGKRPSRAWFIRLDPDRVHTLQIVLPFMQDGFEHRCHGTSALLNHEDGVDFELDVAAEDFERLTKAEDLVTE